MSHQLSDINLLIDIQLKIPNDRVLVGGNLNSILPLNVSKPLNNGFHCAIILLEVKTEAITPFNLKSQIYKYLDLGFEINFDQ